MARKLIGTGAVALGLDINPGSSMVRSTLIGRWLGVYLLKMSIEMGNEDRGCLQKKINGPGKESAI